MNDLERLIDKCDDDLSLALLREGRRPLNNEHRTLSVLAAVGVAGAALGKASWAFAATWKQAAVSAALCVSAGGGLVLYQVYEHRAHPTTAVVSATAPANAGSLNSGSQANAQDTQAGVVLAPDLAAAPRDAAELDIPRPAAANNRRGRASSAPTSPLRHEVALLDQARASLRNAQPVQALDILQRYRTEYPSGALRSEAELVRISALSASGKTREARERARRLVEQNPNSVLADRLRSYLVP